MLDFDIAIELMKKYGFSSTSAHPYIYQNGDNIGICYTYNDEEYGQLERIKLFDNAEDFEAFLVQLQWVKNNGLNYHVKMSLDNYEIMNPKVLFLRNGKVMVEGEMFDIEGFDYRESQRLQMDEVSQLIYEAGDLLLCYDEMKARQLQYLQNIVSLKNTLRNKYFELQKEVDIYNKYKVERNLTLLPDVTDIGINSSMEITIKDRYNMYIAQRPSYEEALDFLRDVWDLNKQLDLNEKYYEALKEENDTRNEIKIVDQKIEMMKDLNSNVKSLFGIDLVSKFKKINKTWSDVSTSVSVENIQQSMSRIEVKYSFFDSLNVLYLADYLKESVQNTNYEDLAEKYAKDSDPNEVNKNRLAPNDIAASLSIQYRDKLSQSEQAILILYNNNKLRQLCNAILEIDDYENAPIKKIISKINNIVGFSKIKTECYDVVKKRLEDPINQNIKNMLFSNFDFTSFESYLASLIKNLIILKNVDYKMALNGDLDMYLKVHNVEDIGGKKFALVTNNLTSLLNETKNTNDVIAITLLKENTPVMYAPYYFDIGDVYNKDASNQMYIKEMVDFEILVEMADVVFNINPIRVPVARYYSEIATLDNYSLVSEIKMAYKTDFCRYTFYNALGDRNVELTQPEVSVGIQNSLVQFETPEETQNVLSSPETSMEAENTLSQAQEANGQGSPVAMDSGTQYGADVQNNVVVSPILDSAVETNEIKESEQTPVVDSFTTPENNNTMEVTKENEVTTIEIANKEQVAEEKMDSNVEKPKEEESVNEEPIINGKEDSISDTELKNESEYDDKSTEKEQPEGESASENKEIEEQQQMNDTPPKPAIEATKPIVESGENSVNIKVPNIIKSTGEGTKIVTTKVDFHPGQKGVTSKSTPNKVSKPVGSQGGTKPVSSQYVKIKTKSGEVKIVPRSAIGNFKSKLVGQNNAKPTSNISSSSTQPKSSNAPIKEEVSPLKSSEGVKDSIDVSKLNEDIKKIQETKE